MLTSFPREKFAKKKGIAPKKKTGKLVYDPEKGDWVPKWGYKGANKAIEEEWGVEVKPNQEGDPRKLNRQERLERIKKNERQMKKNMMKAMKGGAGKR